jgi:hypothetical protein
VNVGHFPPLPAALVGGKEGATLMPKRLISYGYAAIVLGLKVFLAALVIAIGVVFIWIGVTRDPVVLGLIPPYLIIVVWSVYYFMTKRN